MKGHCARHKMKEQPQIDFCGRSIWRMNERLATVGGPTSA